MQPSKLGFGAMRLPSSAAERNKMFDAYLNGGGNYIDTAYAYAGSEEALKGALTSRRPRDSYFLANKMPPWSVNNIKDCERIFKESLKRCGVDYFDFYLLHSMTVENERIAVSVGMYEWAAKMKKEGHVRRVGFSFHDSPETLEKMLNAHPEMDFVMLQLNYADVLRGNSGALHKIAHERNMHIIGMEPIRGGTLANLPEKAEAVFKKYRPGSTPSEWALRYARSLPGVVTVLSGMSNMTQLEENLKTFNPFEPITEADLPVYEEVLVELSKYANIPCTGCRYCVADCPKDIQIPDNIMLYNDLMRGAPKWNRQQMYLAIHSGRRAEDCIACGKCLNHCPQNINIPEALELVKKELS